MSTALHVWRRFAEASHIHASAKRRQTELLSLFGTLFAQPSFHLVSGPCRMLSPPNGSAKPGGRVAAPFGSPPVSEPHPIYAVDDPVAAQCYRDAMRALRAAEVDFLIGGAFAF